jgi:hypothetical protein
MRDETTTRTTARQDFPCHETQVCSKRSQMVTGHAPKIRYTTSRDSPSPATLSVTILRFLFAKSAKINRHTKLIEQSVSHSKQRTGPPINRHTLRPSCSAFSPFPFQFSDPNRDSVAIRNQRKPLIQKEITFSNRNRNGIFSACLSWERQSPDWQICGKHRRSNGFAARPVTAAVDLAAALPYACSLTTLQIVAMRMRPDCGRRNGTHRSWRT